MSHNLLNSLFTYHPREGHSPSENFLTEAFAHVLRKNPDVCRAWVSSLTGEGIEALRGPVEVETQVTFHAPDGGSRSQVVRYGGQLENKWRQIVVRESLAETIRGKATEHHVDAIYGRLRQWSEALFADGQIEKALPRKK